MLAGQRRGEKGGWRTVCFFFCLTINKIVKSLHCSNIVMFLQVGAYDREENGEWKTSASLCPAFRGITCENSWWNLLLC